MQPDEEEKQFAPIQNEGLSQRWTLPLGLLIYATAMVPNFPKPFTVPLDSMLYMLLKKEMCR